MDILAVEEMLKQSHTLELQLVGFINKENAQFVETEEMKILQAYADTTRVLINTMYNECINPHRVDVRSLNSEVIVRQHLDPIALLESLKYSLNVKYGVTKERALQELLKNLNKC
jgi:hypothetical protein